MAKVTIDAKARIRKGVMTNEQFRNRVLEVFGKNDKLLADVREVFLKGLADKFVRPFTDGGDKKYAGLRYHADLGIVSVHVYNVAGEDLGSAVYGKTSFFKCLDD